MRAQYTKKPIGSLEVLSRALEIDLGVLINTANAIDQHYHAHQIPKKKGGFRTINIPTLHLKSIQKKINSRIFSNVVYPEYLFGGIKERDYVKNAAQHAGCKALIALDVKDFYPSISLNAVKDIFQYFFRFPRDVAELLGKLCCLNERVPQGACTSSHLANLSLQENEYHFAQYCKNKGWTYTRLLDDISVSSKEVFQQKDVDAIISKAKAVLAGARLKLNNKKTRILSKANPVDLMEVTGLWLNRGRPRAHRSDRNAIRSEVYQCEILAKEGRERKKYHDFHSHVSGRVSKLAYLEHANSKLYRERLRKILLIYDVNQATNLLRQAEYISKTTLSNRKSVAYYKKYHILKHRLNILMRTDRGLARRIQSMLSLCKPTLQSSDML